MTEAEWLICIDPQRMLEYKSTAKQRKVRLFSAACCRRIWHLIVDERSKRAVEFTERNADGLLTEDELQTARRAAPCPYPPDEACNADPTCEYNTTYAAAVASAYGRASAACAAAYAAGPLTAPFALAAPASSFMYSPSCTARFAVDAVAGNAVAVAIAPFIASGNFAEANTVAFATQKAASLEEEQKQCDLIRCIFGNPFHPSTISPDSLDLKNGTLRDLAQNIYDERAIDRNLVLADAIEKAGGDNIDIVSHLRTPGPHVPGCWVLDLILNKY